MRAADFRYVRPTTLAEAVEQLVAEDSCLLAGGQSLMPALVMRERVASTVVDISDLTELRGLSMGTDEIVVGAAEPLRTLERTTELHAACPALVHAVGTVGAMAIRSRCTLGGSLAWADPTSQVPATLAALGAAVTTTRRASSVPDLMKRGLEQDEIIVRVSIPRLDDHGYGLRQVRRTHITWPVAGAVAVCAPGHARLAMYGAGPTAVVVEADTAEEAVDGVAAVIEPFGDERATAEYRRKVLPVLARRAMAEAEEALHA